jgi:hypothetical protein
VLCGGDGVLRGEGEGGGVKQIPLKGGIEYDCLTPWGRKYINNSRKLIKYAKRKYNKRVRKAGKQVIREAA